MYARCVGTAQEGRGLPHPSLLDQHPSPRALTLSVKGVAVDGGDEVSELDGIQNDGVSADLDGVTLRGENNRDFGVRHRELDDGHYYLSCEGISLTTTTVPDLTAITKFFAR